MKKLLLSILLAGLYSGMSGFAQQPTHIQQLMTKRAEAQNNVTKPLNRPAKSSSADDQTFKDIKFTYATISYMGKYESEDLFGEPLTLGSYYLTLSTGKIDYLGYLDGQGIQVDIMIYNKLPESEDITVPTGTYTPAPMFEETEETFDTLFPEMTVQVNADGSDQLTKTIYNFLEQGTITIKESTNANEYTVIIDLMASNSETYEETAVTGSYSGKISTFNDDPSRCDLLPVADYKMDIPKLRSTYDSTNKKFKLDFYSTPLKSQTGKPGSAEFPCGEGHFFTTTLQLAAKPGDDIDAFATTYHCGTDNSTYAKGQWFFNESNGLGMAIGTYLAIYDANVRPSYTFASDGTVKIDQTDTNGVYLFTLDLSADNGTKMYGSWRGKLDGTPVEDNAIDGILEDESYTPVQYYNLQGIKVENPDNGFFIKHAGNKITKVYIK